MIILLIIWIWFRFQKRNVLFFIRGVLACINVKMISYIRLNVKQEKIIFND